MPHQTPPRPASYPRSRSMGHDERQHGYDPHYHQQYQHPCHEQHDRHLDQHLHRKAPHEYSFGQGISRPYEIGYNRVHRERHYESRPYGYELPRPQRHHSVRSASDGHAPHSPPVQMNDYDDDSPWHRQQHSCDRNGRPYRPTSSDGVNLTSKFAAVRHNPFSSSLFPLAVATSAQSPQHDQDDLQPGISHESDEEAAASALLLAAGGAPRSKSTRNQVKTCENNHHDNQDNRNDRGDNHKDDDATAQTTPTPAPKNTSSAKPHSNHQHLQPCHVSPVSSGSISGGDGLSSYRNPHECDDDDAQDGADSLLDRQQQCAPSPSLVNCQDDKQQHRSFTEKTADGERIASQQALPLPHHNHQMHDQPRPPPSGCNTVAQYIDKPPLPTEVLTVSLSRFPTLLHDVLSNSEFAGSVLEWLPHGRSWRVLRWDEMSLDVLPAFFPELCGAADDDATTIKNFDNEVIGKRCENDRPTGTNNEPSIAYAPKGRNYCDNQRVNLFLSHVKAWGFEEVRDVGLDMGSYRHGLFSRDTPYLCRQMVMSSSPAVSVRPSHLKKDGQDLKHAPPPPQQISAVVSGTVGITRPRAPSIFYEKAMEATTTQATFHAKDSNLSSLLQNQSDRDDGIVSPPKMEKVSTLQVPNLDNRACVESSISKKRRFLRPNDTDRYTPASTHDFHTNTTFTNNDAIEREGEENLYTSFHCPSFTGSDCTSSSYGRNWTPAASPHRVYNYYTARAPGHSPHTAQNGFIPSSPDATPIHTSKLLPPSDARQLRQTSISRSVSETLPVPPFRVSPNRESCSGPRSNIHKNVFGSNNRSVSDSVMAPPHLRSGRGRSRANIIVSTPPTRLNAAEQGTVTLPSSSFPVSTRGKNVRGRPLGRSIMHMQTRADSSFSSSQNVWDSSSDLEMFRKVSDGSVNSSGDNQNRRHHHQHDFVHLEPSLHLTRLQMGSSSSPSALQQLKSRNGMNVPTEYPSTGAVSRKSERDRFY